MTQQIYIHSDPKTAVSYIEKIFSLLNQLECYPHSERCFNEVFTMSLDWLRCFTHKETRLSETRTCSLEYVIETNKKIENKFLFMGYNRPFKIFSKSADELLLIRGENKKETEYQLKRIAGHLTSQREAKIDLIERTLRGINFGDVINGLKELQPAYFTLTDKDNKKISVEYH